MAKMECTPCSEYFQSPQDQIVLLRFDKQAPTRDHQHEFIELSVVLSGKGVHLTGNTRQLLEAGNVLVIGTQRSHQIIESENLNLIVMLIKVDFFKKIAKHFASLPGYHALFTFEEIRWQFRDYRSHLRLTSADLAHLLGEINLLEKELEEKTEISRFLAHSRLSLIIGFVSRRYAAKSEQKQAPEIRLGRLIAWIEEHYAESISNEDLEKKAHMSTSTLIRHFRDSTGLTPMQYLIKTRIHHACEKIRYSRPDQSITEIAFQSGFDDSNYFTRQFTKIMHESPRDYRKKLK